MPLWNLGRDRGPAAYIIKDPTGEQRYQLWVRGQGMLAETTGPQIQSRRALTQFAHAHGHEDVEFKRLGQAPSIKGGRFPWGLRQQELNARPWKDTGRVAVYQPNAGKHGTVPYPMAIFSSIEEAQQAVHDAGARLNEHPALRGHLETQENLDVARRGPYDERILRAVEDHERAPRDTDQMNERAARIDENDFDPIPIREDPNLPPAPGLAADRAELEEWMDFVDPDRDLPGFDPVNQQLGIGSMRAEPFNDEPPPPDPGSDDDGGARPEPDPEPTPSAPAALAVDVEGIAAEWDDFLDPEGLREHPNAAADPPGPDVDPGHPAGYDPDIWDRPGDSSTEYADRLDAHAATLTDPQMRRDAEVAALAVRNWPNMNEAVDRPPRAHRASPSTGRAPAPSAHPRL